MRRAFAALLGGLGVALGVHAASAAETMLPQPASGRIEHPAEFPLRHVAPRDVGIWNNGPQRYAGCYPEKLLATAPEAARREFVDKAANGRPQSDAYLRFLVEELEPAIDAHHSTVAGPGGTFVVGSGIGGLSSLCALCGYPQVFGGAELPGAAAFAGGRHRTGVDRGNDVLDGLYAPALGMFSELLRDRGHAQADAVTRVFEGAGHDETDWAARLDLPLAFLLCRR